MEDGSCSSMLMLMLMNPEQRPGLSEELTWTSSTSHGSCPELQTVDTVMLCSMLLCSILLCSMLLCSMLFCSGRVVHSTGTVFGLQLLRMKDNL